MIVYNVDMTAPYDLGTVATYSCNPGFGLRGGNVIRTCMDAGDGSDGRFDGEAPTCERKQLHDQLISMWVSINHTEQL